MVRTILFSFFVVILVGVVATPGLGAFALLLVPLAGLGVAWWIGLSAATHGHRTEAVVRTRHRQFLGPGGPDDPFAGEDLDEGERSTRLPRY
jgi:hypothetical protein